MGFSVAVIPGDGVGPELFTSSKRVINTLKQKYGLEIEFRETIAGDSALRVFGSALPEQTLKEIEKSDMVLKGPVGESAMDVVVRLRQMYDMYANIRPALSIPGVQTKLGPVDMVVVRENTEDLYKGFEYVIDEGHTVGMKIVTEKASRRICNVALSLSLKRRKRVTCVHKSNVMRVTDGLFAKVCRETFSGKVDFREMYVDAAAANLVRNPAQFDVIVTTNVYGDILSDEAAEIAGSLGIAPSANIGDNKSLFEPVHGAAFDIAGKNIANPTAFLLSISMMLEHIYDKSLEVKYKIASEKLRDAVISVYKYSEAITPDMGGSGNLSKMTEKISEILNGL